MVAITSESKEIPEKEINRFNVSEGDLAEASRELKTMGCLLRLEIITTTKEISIQGLVDQNGSVAKQHISISLSS